MLSNEEKIQQWKNSSTRQEFLENYKAWEIWTRVMELNLTVYKFEVSANQWLVAIEYQSGLDYPVANWYPDVLFYIHDPAYSFKPYRSQKYELMELLKNEKMRLISEKRAASSK